MQTSFALESIQTTFSGSVDFGKRVSCTLPRNGDLVTTLFLEVVLTKHATNASYYPAEQFVKECDIEIGGMLKKKSTVNEIYDFDVSTRDQI